MITTNGKVFEFSDVTSVVGFLLTWVTVTMEEPMSPPSPSAAQLRTTRHTTNITFQTFVTNIVPVISNRTVMAIIIIMGIGVGNFNMLASQLGTIHTPIN